VLPWYCCSTRLYEVEPIKKENVVISVARLFPQKNQAMLIEAFAKVAGKYPDWKLVIYGEGPLRESLESLVQSLQLEGRVLLPGRCHTVIEEMNKAKIFALSSDYEGMSNSMVEAVCVGLPIVSTHVSGTEELINEGVNGYVVKTGDVDAMAHAFDHLMGDEGILTAFGKNSNQKADLFRLDTIVTEWLKLVEKVLVNHG